MIKQGKSSVGKGRPSWWDKAYDATSFEEIRKIIPESEMNDDTISEDAFDALIAAAWNSVETGWSSSECDADFADDSTWFDATTPKELWDSVVDDAEHFKEAGYDSFEDEDEDDDSDSSVDFDNLPQIKKDAYISYFKRNYILKYKYSDELKSKEHAVLVHSEDSPAPYYLDSEEETFTLDIKKVAVYKNYDAAIKAAFKYCNYDLMEAKIWGYKFEIIPLQKLYESKEPNDLVEKFIESNSHFSDFEVEVQRRKNAVNNAISELAEMIDCNEVVKFTQDVLNLYCR